MHRISVHICSKDRQVELAQLLTSLLTQKVHWDLILIDESKQPIVNFEYIIKLINQIRMAGHKVILRRSEAPGVIANRNQAFRLEEEFLQNKWVARIDDDSICDQDYLLRLLALTNKSDAENTIGAVGGIVPLFGVPQPIMDTYLLNGIFNKTTWKDGKIETLADDGGVQWTYAGGTYGQVFESHHLRSSFLINAKAAKEVGYYDTAYGKSAFREETDFCFKLLRAGYKLYTDVQAICWHNRASAGGIRALGNPQEYEASVRICDDYFRRKWAEIYAKDEKFRGCF